MFTTILVILFIGIYMILCTSKTYAEESSRPYELSLSVMYNYLPDAQRRLYEKLYDAILGGDDIVNVTEGISRSDVERLLGFLSNDAPELCAFDRGQTCASDLPGGALSIKIAYRFPLAEQNRFIEEVRSIGWRFSKQNDADGIRAIHDYIIRRFEYGGVNGIPTGETYYALKYNKTVCHGYAQTAAMLCHFAGYACSYALGYVKTTSDAYDGFHAWNLACIKGKLVWFDVTWDDHGSTASVQWFTKDDAEMFKTHKPNSEYGIVLPLKRILPESISFTMHLDINNAQGFVRGVAAGSAADVKKADLKEGEFYSPAIIIYNNGSEAIKLPGARIGYNLDSHGKVGWGETTIGPGGNCTYRLYGVFAEPLRGSTGSHEMIWYWDWYRLGIFRWNIL